MIPRKVQLLPNLAMFILQTVICYLDDSLMVWYVQSSWQVYILSEHARFGVNIFQIM